MYQLDRKYQTITIEGKTLTAKDFESVPDFPNDTFRHDLYTFLKDWFSNSPTLSVQTSGSTGPPKPIQVEKERMMQSARLTCQYLGLKEGDSALLCMNLKYIGAKMVVVRSLIAGLNLRIVTPDGNPLKNTDQSFTFAAMVPLQVFNCLQNRETKERLKSIEHLIIGGGAIDPQIAKEISTFPNHVYSTYGMTETLSHIALRKLNGNDASDRYYPFDSVSLSLSEENALIIDAPLVNSQHLQTNDIAEIFEDGSFRIIGRKDNIINSGGIKIQIEEVEAKLKSVFDFNFAISSISDPKFGEVVVLVTEEKHQINLTQLSEILPSYFIPKQVIQIDEIPLTENGKVSRAKLKALLKL